ncbi:hypothetical protein EGT50_01880 [Rhodococcus xishaensis]|uniref:Uncharacterized protein n=1 Tax=Rhodococcus xishaensis TaxID=2487364 RepID=A0A3S3ADE0_9NOCA|nr:hypothetical protein EGT50_01880 [Rhodococcus xishaensis]
MPRKRNSRFGPHLIFGSRRTAMISANARYTNEQFPRYGPRAPLEGHRTTLAAVTKITESRPRPQPAAVTSTPRLVRAQELDRGETGLVAKRSPASHACRFGGMGGDRGEHTREQGRPRDRETRDGPLQGSE